MDSLAQRIKKILFLILLLSLSLGEVIRIPIWVDKQINLATIATLIFVLFSFLAGKVSLRKARLKKSILILSAIFVLSLVVNLSSLKTNEFLTALFYLLRYISFIGIYFSVLNFDNSFKKKIPYFMIGTGVLILIGGLVQYFLYPSLRNLYYLGWDEHLYRLFGSFLDPNFMGIFLVLVFILILEKFLERRDWVLGLLGIINLIGIILTYSRSAYLALLIGALSLLFFKGKQKLIGMLLLIFIAGEVLLFLIPLRSEGTNLFRATSTWARLSSSKTAVEIFKRSPILGVGFDAYEFTAQKNNPMNSKYVNHASSGTDNSFLFVLATTGITGLIVFLYFWQKALSLNRKSYLWPALASSFLVLLVSSMFVNSFFYSFNMIWMWILLALAEE